MKEIKFYPMAHRPNQVEGELYSETVLVYDEDLETTDLGYFDFESQQWNILGDFSMRLKCWCEIPCPKELVKDNWNIELHEGYRP